MDTRLYRSQNDRILGGVCAGLANYLRIDTVLVRLFFIVFTLLGGIGPLAYIILWIVVPSEEQITGKPGEPVNINGDVMRERAHTFRDEFVNVIHQPGKKTGVYIGVALIFIGGYIFLKNLNIPWLAWINNNVILAALIIIVGIVLVAIAFRRDK